jgi:hypothetical protein
VTIKDRLEEFKQQKKLLFEDAKDEIVRILNSQWAAHKDKTIAFIKKQADEQAEKDNEIFLGVEEIELSCNYYNSSMVMCKYTLKFLASDKIRLETNRCMFVCILKYEYRKQQHLQLIDKTEYFKPKDTEDMLLLADLMSNLFDNLNPSVTIFPKEEQTNESC